jgi:hypothetical protein
MQREEVEVKERVFDFKALSNKLLPRGSLDPKKLVKCG